MTNQEKRERVIEALKCITSSGNDGMKDDCASCLYSGGGDCLAQALKDALALLESQEPVKPVFDAGDGKTIGQFLCGKCHAKIGFGHPNFCWYCGRAVKWK